MPDSFSTHPRDVRAKPVDASRAGWTASTRLLALVVLSCATWMPPIAAAQSVVPGLPGTAATQPAAAEAPSLDSSVDDIVRTLEDDRQRGELIDSLKKLQAARRAANPDHHDERNGLLGLISSGIESLQDEIGGDSGPRQVWQRKLRSARHDLGALLDSPTEPWTQTALHFLLVVAFWALTAFGLIRLIEWIARRYGGITAPSPDIRTVPLLVFLLSRIAPWTIALVVAIQLARRHGDDTGALGQVAGLVVAYSWVGGAVFAAVGLLLFSLFANGHRRHAARVLLTATSARTLFAAGVLAALADAMTNPKVVPTFGADLSEVAAIGANLLAAATIVFFVSCFRRPVDQLLSNRPYAARRGQPFATHLLQIAAPWWHMPVLLLITVSTVVTLASPTRSEMALRQAIVTAILMTLGIVATALIVRPSRAASQRSRYTHRFVGFARTLVALALWVAIMELAGRIWGFSPIDWVDASPSGQRIFATLRNIGGTLLVGWFVWIVIDTAIHEAIAPIRPRRGARITSTRALTVLPLLRNVLFIVLLTLGLIATLSDLGVNVAPLLAGAGVVGLAIGFGAQTLVKDLITGVFILVEDSMSLGDWVNLDGKAGTVESLTIRTVRLRDGDGALHSIPFSSITTIKNHSKQFGYALFNIRITYESDVDEAIRLIRETATEVQRDAMIHRHIIAPLEVWGLDRFEAEGVVLQARIKTMPQTQSTVSRAFNRRLKEKFDATPAVDFAGGKEE